MNSAMPMGLPTYDRDTCGNVFAWILAQAAAIKRQRMVAEAYKRMIRHARRVGADCGPVVITQPETLQLACGHQKRGF